MSYCIRHILSQKINSHHLNCLNCYQIVKNKLIYKINTALLTKHFIRQKHIILMLHMYIPQNAAMHIGLSLERAFKLAYPICRLLPKHVRHLLKANNNLNDPRECFHSTALLNFCMNSIIF